MRVAACSAEARLTHSVLQVHRPCLHHSLSKQFSKLHYSLLLGADFFVLLLDFLTESRDGLLFRAKFVIQLGAQLISPAKCENFQLYERNS